MALNSQLTPEGWIVDTIISPLNSRRNRRLGVAGDSLMANWYGQGAGGQQYKSSGPLFWAMILSGQRMEVVRDVSTGSTTLDPTGVTYPNIPQQIDMLIAERCDEIIVNGGRNDQNLGATLAQLKSRMLGIVKKVEAAGVPLLRICDLPTRGGASAAVNGDALAYNAWLLTLPSKYSFVRICSWFNAVIDPNSASAGWKSGYLDPDNVHWSSTGSYYAGKYLAAQWIRDYPEAEVLVASDVDSRTYTAASNKLLPTPMWLTGAPIPSGWSAALGAGATLTTAASKAARADGFGNDIIIPVKYAAQSDNYVLNGPDLKGFLTLGEKIRFLISIEVAVNADEGGLALSLAWPRTRLGLTMSNAALNQNVEAFPLLTAESAIPEPFKGVIATPWLDTGLSNSGGATVTALLPQFMAIGKSAGGALIKVGRPTIEVRV